MQPYELLQTIYAIAKDDPRPESYPCRPRELILRLLQDWSLINEQLLVLEKEGLIRMSQQDTLVIFIKTEGIQKISEGREINQKR